MAEPKSINHYALFDDVVAVAKAAHEATAGWRAICVRAQRTVGKQVIQAVAGLDLAEELPALAARVGAVVRHVPAEVDTLVFGLFDGIDDDGTGIFTGFHLVGTSGIDPVARWLLGTPTWQPKDRFLASPALDTIARVAVTARGEVKKAASHTLRFGAAALLGRFATEALPHRVVVAFDDGDFAIIRDGVMRSAPTLLAPPSFALPAGGV